jgi:hypothetical protein
MSTVSHRYATLLAALVLAGAGTTLRAEAQSHAPKNPDTAPQASIDRFSAKAGKLQVRTATNGLPGPNQPVDFDRGPFITQGFAPNGAPVRYYNFDVQSTTPAPIYVLFREGEDTPVNGQLNVIDVVPGDGGYNDFWQIVKVTVPQIRKAGYRMETTPMLVNCPVVPRGSTARTRVGGESAELQRGWYRGQVVFYFTFEERVLQVTQSGEVPRSPIYVTFTINPDQPGGGPPSGFVTERGAQQTHNVVQTVPSDAGYSPLWLVNVYDNAEFARVRDLPSALRARVLGAAVANVNCPVVWVAARG